MKNIYLQIKWAYQRVFRRYDDRVFWSFEEYLSDYIIPLKEFCEEELKSDWIDNNPERKEIFTKTLELIERYYESENDYNKYYSMTESTSNLWKYFGEHIRYYWN